MPLPFCLDPTTVAEDQKLVVDFAQTFPTAGPILTYFDALNLIQRATIPSVGGTPPLVFDRLEPQTASILANFDPGLTDRRIELTNLTAPEQAQARSCMTKARALLDRFDSRVVGVIDSLVGGWVLVRSPGVVGGSFWYALGTVWLSPRGDWTAWDYAENVLHESTHQATFLSDMVRGLFAGDASRMSQSDALVRSPIRRVPRRYDFAFHAAMVSAALVDFNDQLARPERARELFSGLAPCLEQLREREVLLTEHGLSTLTRLEQYVSAMRVRVAIDSAA